MAVNMELSILLFGITARLAQSVEHETLNLRVVGSSPTLGDQIFFLTFLMPQSVYQYCNRE